MKRSRMMGYFAAGALVLLAVTLTTCGGGYGGGGMGYAPAGFSLSSPADTATGVTTTPTLQWTSSLYATGYRVQIDTMNTFPAPVVNTVVAAPATTFTVPVSTLTTTLYYWRVIAENAYGQAVSGPRSFTP
jgi:hypothetical protein